MGASYSFDLSVPCVVGLVFITLELHIRKFPGSSYMLIYKEQIVRLAGCCVSLLLMSLFPFVV